MRTRAARGLAAVAAAASTIAGVLACERAAVAGLFIDRLPELDACSEAATFAESDKSPAAERARRRCRLEMFQQTLAYEQARAAPLQDKAAAQATAIWMENAAIPARVLRRNAVDGFVSSGLVVYGLALAGVFWPSVEGELWIGWRDNDHYTAQGNLSEGRRCIGGRGKWLPNDRGNVSLLLGAGVAHCQIDVALYNFSGMPGTPNGDAVAHVATASAGVTWTSAVGFRMSLEYVYAHAFYVQASSDQPNHPHDQDKRDAVDAGLADDRHGLRLQVGYAF